MDGGRGPVRCVRRLWVEETRCALVPEDVARPNVSRWTLVVRIGIVVDLDGCTNRERGNAPEPVVQRNADAVARLTSRRNHCTIAGVGDIDIQAARCDGG